MTVRQDASGLRARLRAPSHALDRRLAAPRHPALRLLAWAVVNYLVLVLGTVAACLLLAVPPLSLLPSEGGPLVPADVVLLVLVFGSLSWPLHLAVVALVSRTRRARLWMVLASPLQGAVVLCIPYVLAPFDTTNRAVVLAWTLSGLLCRPLPRSRAPAA